MRILYVDVDSLRPDHLGCYGYHRDTSPAIDRLADRGRRFEAVYASDTPCLPSRTALFTGRFGIHTGAVAQIGTATDVRGVGRERGFNRLGEFATLPGALVGAGHRTASVSPFPTRHGASWVLDGVQDLLDPQALVDDAPAYGLLDGEVVTERALEWLDANAAGEDWFCHVNYWDPHHPYDTPAAYGNPFADDPPPEWPDAETIREQYEGYGVAGARDLHAIRGNTESHRTPGEIRDREDFRGWIDGYDVGIRYADDQIARLLDALEAAGVLEETLVVVSADHGEAQGEFNAYGAHTVPDRATSRVPLVVAGPGVEGGVDAELHYALDLAPTLCDLAGVDPPGRWDGDSFAPSIRAGDAAGRDELVTSHLSWSCGRSVRWDDWLLMRTYHPSLRPVDPVTLFDVAEDPHQTTDLSEEYPSVVDEGLARLGRWTDARLREAAEGDRGGAPDAPDALVDPLWAVLRAGGPHAARRNAEDYLDRLRETGREEAADALLARLPDRSPDAT